MKSCSTSVENRFCRFRNRSELNIFVYINYISIRFINVNLISNGISNYNNDHYSIEKRHDHDHFFFRICAYSITIYIHMFDVCIV